jgi:phosphoadenosine phosphosulfate reductase
MTLKEKVREAVKFLREHEPPEGYTVKFSGGKDSIVMYDIVKKSGVKFQAFYHWTDIEPPEVASFIKEYYPEVTWVKPRKSFWELVVRIGPPTKIKRWCSTKLKYVVRIKGASKHVIAGLRAEESWRRAKRGRISYNADARGYVYSPLFYFTKDEIWEYIKKEHLPYSSLYDEGFKRTGCVVCPFICGTALLEEHKKRWKDIYKKFEESVREHFEERKEFYQGIGVRNAEEFLEKWYAGKRIGNGG